jgi:hypothetical protein
VPAEMAKLRPKRPLLWAEPNHRFHSLSPFCHCCRKGTLGSEKPTSRLGSIDSESTLDCILWQDDLARDCIDSDLLA